MAEQRIVFDPQSLLHLLIHYTQDCEDRIPLDGELVSAGVSPIVGRWIGLQVRSDKWEPEGWSGTAPPFLHVRYEGRKVASWTQHGNDAAVWHETVEAPKST